MFLADGFFFQVGEPDFRGGDHCTGLCGARACRSHRVWSLVPAHPDANILWEASGEEKT